MMLEEEVVVMVMVMVVVDGERDAGGRNISTSPSSSKSVCVLQLIHLSSPEASPIPILVQPHTKFHFSAINRNNGYHILCLGNR